MQHESPVPLDVAPGNNLGATGAEALSPALEGLTSLEILNLSSTCGDVQRRSSSTQWEQCRDVQRRCMQCVCVCVCVLVSARVRE